MLAQALILVGGRGERLGPLTKSTPKPMMRIGDQTFLEVLVDNVARHGVQEILLLCGYRAESIRAVFEGTRWRGARVRCLVEDRPMGTGGALRIAAGLLDAEFLLLNGDSLFDINLLDLLTIAPGRPWLGKLALRSLPETGRFGTLALDGERIVSFAEKTTGGPGMINGGIYLLKREILERMPARFCSLERDVLPRLAEEGLLFGRTFDHYFIDIGVPDDLARAQAEIPLRQRVMMSSDRYGAQTGER